MKWCLELRKTANLITSIAVVVSAVAAGSVVTKDVEAWTVVGGNPAKFIKKRELIA